jgi:hypothetical protein
MLSNNALERTGGIVAASARGTVNVAGRSTGSLDLTKCRRIHYVANCLDHVRLRSGFCRIVAEILSKLHSLDRSYCEEPVRLSPIRLTWPTYFAQYFEPEAKCTLQQTQFRPRSCEHGTQD